jgi:hypothetical protein
MTAREEVVAWLAGRLERPAADLQDGFDVVADHGWPDADDLDALLANFVRDFRVRDERFDFRHAGPAVLRPLAWLGWRLFRYPTIRIGRLTVGDMVRIAGTGAWDRSIGV